MSSIDRIFVELFPTLRTALLGVFLVLAARELSSFAAKGNKVITDFNRAVQAETLQRLLPDPDAEH